MTQFYGGRTPFTLKAHHGSPELEQELKKELSAVSGSTDIYDPDGELKEDALQALNAILQLLGPGGGSSWGKPPRETTDTLIKKKLEETLRLEDLASTFPKLRKQILNLD